MLSVLPTLRAPSAEIQRRAQGTSYSSMNNCPGKNMFVATCLPSLAPPPCWGQSHSYRWQFPELPGSHLLLVPFAALLPLSMVSSLGPDVQLSLALHLTATWCIIPERVNICVVVWSLFSPIQRETQKPVLKGLSTTGTFPSTLMRN